MFQKIDKNGPEFQVLKKNFIPIKHWQSTVEIVYIKKGYLKILIDEENLNLKDKEMLIIGSGIFHQYKAVSKDFEIYILKFQLKDILFDWIEHNKLLKMENNFKKAFYLKNIDIVEEYFSNLVNVEKKFIQEYEIMASTMRIANFIMSNKENSYPIICKAKPVRDDVKKISSFLRKNIQNGLTISDLAEHLDMSENYTSKYFKKIFDMNLKTYMDILRVNMALNLLDDTNMKISQIASECGFNSIQTFNRVFKKIMKISPREYKKSGIVF